MARLAATLDATALMPVNAGARPAWDGSPVSSPVVGWPMTDGARYGIRALCATIWNVVRMECTLCDCTRGITSMGVDTAKAETCNACGRDVKVTQGQKNEPVDAVVDDVGSLGLDMLVQGTSYQCDACDPFLLGY